MNPLTHRPVLAELLLAVMLGLPSSLPAQRSGVQIWQQNCGRCHTLQPANRYTADLWETIMTEMRLAARLSDAEADKILEFLQSGAKTAALAPPTAPAPAWALEYAALGSLALPGAAQPDGEVIFMKWCVACHGEQGKGDGPAAAAYDPKPANFTARVFWTSRPDSLLQEVIEHGKGGMPSFAKQLDDQAVLTVIQYLKELRRKADDKGKR